MILIVFLRFFETEKANHDLIDHDECQKETADPRQRFKEYPDELHFPFSSYKPQGTGPVTHKNT